VTGLSRTLLSTTTSLTAAVIVATTNLSTIPLVAVSRILLIVVDGICVLRILQGFVVRQVPMIDRGRYSDSRFGVQDRDGTHRLPG
jgi:hypothetical protein